MHLVTADLLRQVWERIQQAAETAYDCTSECPFTTFVGCEYTATTLGASLHRNVVFRNANVPDLSVFYFEGPIPQSFSSGFIFRDFMGRIRARTRITSKEQFGRTPFST